MNKMDVYYISIEGNTKHFLTVMSNTFKNVKLHQITNMSDLYKFSAPYFCFVPTYVKGTQESKDSKSKTGQNFQIEEMDTLTMNDELGFKKNYQNCLGLVGSGNKNFGEDCYCWTALHYHRKYHIPVIDNYEIRGTFADENRINAKMVKIWNQHVNNQQKVTISKHQMVNPMLKKLQEKYKGTKKWF